MTPDDLDLVIEWAAAEGWNPGLADAAAFRSVDPAGLLVGVLDGRPVSSVSVVRYPGGFAFLGFYIVRPEHRGNGHGLATWRAGMAHGRDCNIGLDGVVAQQDNYRRSGFRLAHRNVRHCGTAAADMPADPGLVPLADIAPDRLQAYDRGCFPAERRAFLRVWAAAPRRGYALVRDGELRGYGVVRACRQGSKIGPLFADDRRGGELLFRALAAAAPAQPLSIDLPEPNAEARRLVEGWGMAPVFETARMYTGADPGLPLGRVYGITTFELG
ncbi:MAG TPA: GNAT family N-acetyltransferase [Geminicoccaceae bacterium]|nr:GNAT family N-acetyltransferase [Geminicoccus sp.]HMU50583.1 GNAT family N-acetyltransferase [Geminicoccaceae bacterium]